MFGAIFDDIFIDVKHCLPLELFIQGNEAELV